MNFMSSYSGLKPLGKSYSPVAMAIYTSVLTVPIIGCSDDSDSSDVDPATAITLSNETISSPGTHFVLVTNTADYEIRILSFSVNSLPEGVLLDSEKNQCDSIILKAGESCTFSYSVSEDAYGETERPITIQYAAADIGPVYSTDDQATIPTLSVDGVSLVFENGDFIVKRASMSGPESTDVEIKNLGPFTWQLEVDPSIFSVEKSSENGAEPSGLSVQASAVNSCIGDDGTVPVGSSCFVSVRSTDENADDTVQYILKVNAKNSRNIASDISRNFSLLNAGAVTAAVSTDSGTVYPAIKAIKISNTINFTASIVARLDSESFEVYDQSPEQIWCNTDWCRKSCYTQEHPFVYPESRSIEIAAISGQTAGSCYVYLRPEEELAVAETTDAELFISNSRSDVTREFLVAGKGVLYAGGYFTESIDGLESSYIGQYDGSWSKLIPEAGVQEVMQNLTVDGQGRLYVKRGFGSNGYVGRQEANGWVDLADADPSLVISGSNGTFIADESGALYVAGYFDGDAGGDLRAVGKFDGDNWDAAFLDASRTQFLEDYISRLALDDSGNLYSLNYRWDGDTYHQSVHKYDSSDSQWSDFINVDGQDFISSFVNGPEGNKYISGWNDTANTYYVSQYNESTQSWDSLDFPHLEGYLDTSSLIADREGNLYIKGGDLFVYSASEKSWSSIDLSELGSTGPIILDDSGNIYAAYIIDQDTNDWGVRGYSPETMQWDEAGVGPSGEVFNRDIYDFAISNLIDISAR